jgi:hypothetical protein
MKIVLLVMVFFFGCLTSGAKVLNCRNNQGENLYSNDFFIKFYLNGNVETIISALPAVPVPPHQIHCASSNRLVTWIDFRLIQVKKNISKINGLTIKRSININENLPNISLIKVVQCAPCWTIFI